MAGPRIATGVQRIGNPVVTVSCSVRQPTVHILKIVESQPNLLEVVAALTSPCGFAGRLDRRQKQRDQNPDDRDDHQEFDQCETTS
jgi:hypothetical protein